MGLKEKLQNTGILKTDEEKAKIRAEKEAKKKRLEEEAALRRAEEERKEKEFVEKIKTHPCTEITSRFFIEEFSNTDSDFLNYFRENCSCEIIFKKYAVLWRFYDNKYYDEKHKDGFKYSTISCSDINDMKTLETFSECVRENLINANIPYLDIDTIRNDTSSYDGYRLYVRCKKEKLLIGW